MAVCIAIVGKENYPLFLKTIYRGDKELRIYYTVHTSLDVVEEKVLATGKNTSDVRDLYLGLLYPTEDYKVYGYATSTRVKIIVIIESVNSTLRDNEIRTMFRKLHAAYIDIVSNPFYRAGDKITSRTFYDVVSSMMVSDGGPPE
jgi:hypothetical protein